MLSDSMLTLGWYDHENYVICPNKYVNLGRFLNGSKKKETANVKVEWCISKNKIYGLMIAKR